MPPDAQAKIESGLPERFPAHITGIRDALLTGPRDPNTGRCSVILGRAALKRLKKLVYTKGEKGTALTGYAKEWMTTIANLLPIEVADEAINGWDENTKEWESWRPFIQVFQDQLRFRQMMVQELAAK
jgi:hypothetical protein